MKPGNDNGLSRQLREATESGKFEAFPATKKPGIEDSSQRRKVEAFGVAQSRPIGRNWARMHPMVYFRGMCLYILAHHEPAPARCSICLSQYRFPVLWEGVNQVHGNGR